MTTKRLEIAMAAALLAIASPAAAQTTTIDFDDLTTTGCTFGTAPIVDVQYSAMGATFSGNISSTPHVVPATCLTVTGGSAPNFVALDGSGNYLRIDITPSVHTVTIGVGNYNRIETFTLTAYDLDGAVLATSMVMPPFRMMAPITVSSATGISAVVLTAAHSENVVDDVVLDASAIDAGVTVDAGTDAAVIVDAGSDAGNDAGSDAAMAIDAGSDAGARDAATTDAARADAATNDAATAPHDVGTDAASAPPPASRSCGCTVVGARSGASSALALVVVGWLLSRRRARRPPPRSIPDRIR